MSSDSLNEPTELNDNLFMQSSYRPWNNVIQGRSTCATSIYDIQHDLMNKGKPTIGRKGIAETDKGRTNIIKPKIYLYSI